MSIKQENHSNIMTLFPSSSLLIIFIASFLIFSLPEFASAQDHDLINKTCRASAKNDPENISFNFCRTALQAAPASRCATLKGLGMISIRLVRYNVTDTRCAVKQLLANSSKLDPSVKGCLDACFELYSDAIDSVKQAMKYYNSGRFEDANIQMSSVLDAATTCEDGFHENEKKVKVSPLMKRNNDTFQLSAISLSLMHFVQGGSD